MITYKSKEIDLCTNYLINSGSVLVNEIRTDSSLAFAGAEIFGTRPLGQDTYKAAMIPVVYIPMRIYVP